MELTWEEAKAILMAEGRVKLPEWDGHWFGKGGQIFVETGDGQILSNPHIAAYADREDWQETDGFRCIGGARKLLLAGHRVSIVGEPKSTWIEYQKPYVNSEMTSGYFFVRTANNKRTPWLPTHEQLIEKVFYKRPK